MSEILDSLGTAIGLTFVAWLVIMLPMSAALAYRRRWNVGYALLLACLPVPFLGWAVVATLSSRHAHRVGSGVAAYLPAVASTDPGTTTTSPTNRGWDL